MIIIKCNAHFKIYLIYVLQCRSEWGTYYTLMNVGYAHTIYAEFSLADTELRMRSTFL